MEGGRRVSWGVPIVGRERPTFLLLWNMKNGEQIRTQLAEKHLKLDSSSLEYEIAPTGPRPAQCVSRCSPVYISKSPPQEWGVNIAFMCCELTCKSTP